MSNPPTVFQGVVHGKTIELDHGPGLPDGQHVTVTVDSANHAALPAGEGLRRSAGAWADDAEELDRFLSWSRE
jgi:hypothetical protein